MAKGALRAAHTTDPWLRRIWRWAVTVSSYPVVWLMLWLGGAAAAIALVGLVMLRPW